MVVDIRKKKNNSGTQCTLCETDLQSKSHSHLVRTYINFESQLTQVTGFVCCTCISRISAAQVPSPYEDEAAQNNIKESAPVPFTPRIDWGDFASLQYFKKLTDKEHKAQHTVNQLRHSTASAEGKAW